MIKKVLNSIWLFIILIIFLIGIRFIFNNPIPDLEIIDTNINIIDTTKLIENNSEFIRFGE